MSSTPLLPTHRTDASGALSAQRAAITSQNAALDDLSAGVSSVKAVATALSGETDAQNSLLDELATDMSRVNSRAGRAVERTAAVVRDGDAYNFKTFCMLLWPLVLLIVLLVEAVIHFVF